MTTITAEYLDSLPTAELHSLFWEWYKECEGFRPRHVCSDDREGMLSWCKRELDPVQIAMREQQFAYERRMFDDWQARQNERIEEEEREKTEIDRITMELVAAYNTGYDHFDPRLGLRMGKARSFAFCI